MNNDKKFHILTAFTVSFFVFVVITLILSCIFPGEIHSLSPHVPWYAWTVIGGTIAYITALLVFFCVIYSKKKKNKTENKG